jgi:hypothetical protein
MKFDIMARKGILARCLVFKIVFSRPRGQHKARIVIQWTKSVNLQRASGSKRVLLSPSQKSRELKNE